MTSCGASVDGMLKRVYPCRQDRNILNRRMRSLRICAGKKCRKERETTASRQNSQPRDRERGNKPGAQFGNGRMWKF